MLKSRLYLLMTLSLAALSTNAAEAHVHGVASLQVAVDGSSLSLNLSSPLVNLLGFEHLPHTDKQKAAVAEMARKLRQADKLFAPTSTAGCKLKSGKLESVALGNAKKEDHEDGGDHADMDAEFVFQCGHPAELHDLDVKLFAAFPGLHQLKTEVVTQRGQTAATLTPSNHRIKW